MSRKALVVFHRRTLMPILFLVLFAGAWAITALVAKNSGQKPVHGGSVSLIMDYAWPEYKHRITIEPSPLATEFCLALQKPSVRDEGSRGMAYRKITVLVSGRPVRSVWVTRTGEVVDSLRHGRVLGDTELHKMTAALAQRADREFFGEPLTWPEVAPAFPVGGIATVRDLETGLKFTVRRHRGDSHADVEPQSDADTATLKRVYGGAWSWRRRAVVVTVGGRCVAGSINGMPHGWGDIFDNQFVGHFCIHFRGSRVHTTWRQDPGHQLMVLKASGELARELDTAAPERVAHLVLAAVHQRESATLRHAVTGTAPAALKALIAPIRHLSLISVRPGVITGKEATVDADLIVYYSVGDPQAGHRKRLTLHLVRRDGIPGWKVRSASLKGLCIPTMAAVRTPAKRRCMQRLCSKMLVGNA